MTHQQEFLCVLAALPSTLGVGLWLGHFILSNRLNAQLFSVYRPQLRLGKRSCRVVTEEEYQWLKATCRIRDVD